MIEKKFNRGLVTKTFTLAQHQQYASDPGKLPIDESSIPNDGITFYVMRLAKVIVVRPQGDFFIGRNVEEESWNPQVNLAELDGFADSVSRRHAMIHPLEHGYEITDLFSKNGTMLDDRRLVPNVAYRLISGMQLVVGREQLMVIFR
jgi:pSer/pThr/pTyr-binding forkhead associated (FHA) protein